jgi:hypothetical protein
MEEVAQLIATGFSTVEFKIRSVGHQIQALRSQGACAGGPLIRSPGVHCRASMKNLNMILLYGLSVERDLSVFAEFKLLVSTLETGR